MLELPTRSAIVSETLGPEFLDNTSESGAIELPASKNKWMQEENKMLWKFYFESDKNFRGYMERKHRLWIERRGRDKHQCKTLKRKICCLMLR